MMGIPCKGPAYISGDNQSVLANKTLRIILSVRETDEKSGGHHMSILMTMRHISSPSYFPPVKSENVLSETFYTISFIQTQRRRLSHGVWNNTMMVYTTPKSDNRCRTIRTTIYFRSSCGSATFIFILCFYILKIFMPT